jgi:hypothetical protein
MGLIAETKRGIIDKTEKIHCDGIGVDRPNGRIDLGTRTNQSSPTTRKEISGNIWAVIRRRWLASSWHET